MWQEPIGFVHVKDRTDWSHIQEIHDESEQDFIFRSKKRGFLKILHTNESKF